MAGRSAGSMLVWDRSLIRYSSANLHLCVLFSLLVATFAVAPPAVAPPPMQPAAFPAGAVKAQMPKSNVGGVAATGAVFFSGADFALRGQPSTKPIPSGLKSAEGALKESLMRTLATDEAAHQQFLTRSHVPTASITESANSIGVIILAAVAGALASVLLLRRSARSATSKNAVIEMIASSNIVCFERPMHRNSVTDKSGIVAQQKFAVASLVGDNGNKLREIPIRARCGRAARHALPAELAGTQLEELAKVTTLSIDTGDLDVIAEYASTGLISDATTNPLFVSQAGLSGDPRYIAFVDEAVAYAKAQAKSSDTQESLISLAMDRLAVNLGKEISALVPGYVSTEVDIRESFDIATSVARARRIMGMYEELGVARSRVLIKLAATWEGIKAAEILEKEGITCNLTLVFGFAQAVACAQAGVRLISPFPGRILDWHKNNGGSATYAPEEDPGVVAVKRMYSYYKRHGHELTICMPASWRPSRGPGHETDELVALAGVDRMTIPPPILEKLASSREPLPRVLEPAGAASACADDQVQDGCIQEKAFRMLMNEDVCATTKLAEGINAFLAETAKLTEALATKF